MGHSRLDIPGKTFAGRVHIGGGRVPGTDSNVNQAFAVTQAQGGQTLLDGLVGKKRRLFEQPCTQRFRK